MTDPATIALTPEQLAQDTEEWRYVQRIIMRWPRQGVCSAEVSQMLISAISEKLAERTHLLGERS